MDCSRPHGRLNEEYPEGVTVESMAPMSSPFALDRSRSGARQQTTQRLDCHRLERSVFLRNGAPRRDLGNIGIEVRIGRTILRVGFIRSKAIRCPPPRSSGA